jgi:hypothetical protein
MLITNQTKFFKDPIKAEQVAATMQAEDQDWVYTPMHCPKGTGFSYIQIKDEDGLVVGNV